jgi:hypothetical protein
MFTEAIPEALETSCGKCSPKQRVLIKTVIRAVIERHPEAWNQLLSKYDKDSAYRENIKKFIDEKE